MKKSNKTILFKVRGNTVEEVDGCDMTIEDVEKTKSCLAALHAVTYDEVEVIAKDTEGYTVSNTLASIHGMGLAYKAPREYAVYRKVEGVKMVKPNLKSQESIDEFLDELLSYLKGNDETELFSFT